MPETATAIILDATKGNWDLWFRALRRETACWGIDDVFNLDDNGESLAENPPQRPNPLEYNDQGIAAMTPAQLQRFMVTTAYYKGLRENYDRRQRGLAMVGSYINRTVPENLQALILGKVTIPDILRTLREATRPRQ